jgi:hypothetical protein
VWEIAQVILEVGIPRYDLTVLLYGWHSIGNYFLALGANL